MHSEIRATAATGGQVNGWPRAVLRLEGLAIAAASTLAYAALGESWWLFVLLLLAPDIAAVAYLAGPRAGAAFYNGAHTFVSPLALLVVVLLAGWPNELLGGALVWIAHIGIDRALGFGLKHPDGFRVTHLGTIGRS